MCVRISLVHKSHREILGRVVKRERLPLVTPQIAGVRTTRAAGGVRITQIRRVRPTRRACVKEIIADFEVHGPNVRTPSTTHTTVQNGAPGHPPSLHVESHVHNFRLHVGVEAGRGLFSSEIPRCFAELADSSLILRPPFPCSALSSPACSPPSPRPCSCCWPSCSSTARAALAPARAPHGWRACGSRRSGATTGS